MTWKPRERVPLAGHTTLEVGGPARYFVEATDVGTIDAALAWAEDRSLPLHVLGSGSNVLIADRGLEAVVLRPRLVDLQVDQAGAELAIRAGAGVVWNDLVELAVARGAAGIECLAGIPGEVGAAPIQNVGAYGQEVASAIVAVHAVDRRTGRPVTLERDACAFGYRDSLFKRSGKNRYVIVAVELRLRIGEPPQLAYAELAQAVRRSGQAPTLTAVRDTVLDLRRSKSMLHDEADPNHRSAGSFFVNPTLTEPEFAVLVERTAEVLDEGERVPHHPATPGRVKVPAAWLIERAGLPKGTHRGPVGLSSRHSLAIVNRGGATAQGIVDFASEIRSRVRERFGVGLTPEPQLLGFDPAELAPLCD